MALRPQEIVALERFKHYFDRCKVIGFLAADTKESVFNSVTKIEQNEITLEFIIFPGTKVTKTFPTEFLFVPQHKLQDEIEKYISEQNSKLFQ